MIQPDRSVFFFSHPVMTQPDRVIEFSAHPVVMLLPQVFGRAGRPQYDTSGEAIMITTHKSLDK